MSAGTERTGGGSSAGTERTGVTIRNRFGLLEIMEESDQVYYLGYKVNISKLKIFYQNTE